MKERNRLWEFVLKTVGKHSIKSQLFTVYTLALVLPMLIIGTFLVVNTYNLLSKSQNDLINADNARVRSLLFGFTVQVNNLSDSIYFDETLQNTLKADYDEPDDFRRAVNRIDILDNYRKTYVEIKDISIYTDNPDIVDYKQFLKVDDTIENLSWYQKALNQSGAFWTSRSKKTSAGTTAYYLCLVRQIPLLDSDKHAVLVLWINDDYLRSSIENPMYQTMISVGDENAFYSSNIRLANTPMPIEINREISHYSSNERITMDDKICLTTLSTINTYMADSKLYVLTINKNGYYEVWNIIKVCLGILGVSIVVPGILILAFTRYLTGRIELLRGEMHKASLANYELVPVAFGQDEISEAHRDLEIMVEKIKANDAFVYESKIKEQEIVNKQREMEYKMLASQINPHFLYNTLETIRMKAFTAGDREVADATKLLGKSMRYVLENTGTKKTTLSKELEHIEVYLKIQQIRFQDRFRFKLEIEEGLDPDKIYVLPLLLQPLVENSMVHGLENLEENGFIQVSVFEDEKFYNIIVSDNGEGMDENTLNKLRQSIISDATLKSSIGLYNINQRLKLLYNDEYAFIIDSKEGEGTRVTLSIPKNKCEE